MECVRNCKLCPKFILSSSITFTGGNLVVNLPANTYGNCQEYCIVLAQSLPDETTINAPVVFTIGTDTTTTYPFLNCNCSPILASQVRTRRVYKVCVSTSVNTGAFKYVGNCPLPSNSTTLVNSLPTETTATPANTK